MDTAPVEDDRRGWIADSEQGVDGGRCRGALRAVTEEDRGEVLVEAVDRLGHPLVSDVACAGDCALPVEALQPGVGERQAGMDVLDHLELAHGAYTRGEVDR